MSYQVVVTPEARAQLYAIFDHIAMAYAVERETVLFVGIFYGGQDFEALLSDL